MLREEGCEQVEGEGERMEDGEDDEHWGGAGQMRPVAEDEELQDEVVGRRLRAMTMIVSPPGVVGTLDQGEVSLIDQEAERWLP